MGTAIVGSFQSFQLRSLGLESPHFDKNSRILITLTSFDKNTAILITLTNYDKNASG
jgi:hypothetical protein